MTPLPRHAALGAASLMALFLVVALACPPARTADKAKKDEKEKKEKIEPWVEVRTAHFIVASDGGEGTARRFAREFEQLLHVFQTTMPNSRISTGIPVRILAARDGQSFARMLPEYPYDKRHEQPAGIFVSGPEKTFIGLRANASGRFPREDIVRDYTRVVLKSSYRNLPPWLEEGFYSVYANLTFADRGARLERPDPDDLSVLFESPLLPLDIVFHADRASGYYSPGDKNTVYFAESRVLVNFLIGDPQISASKSLDRYVAAVEGGADSLEAAHQAFGDLNQLQARLEDFIKQVKGTPADMSGSGDSAGPVKSLSAPEAEALMADFMAARGKDADALDALGEALRADPNLAEAEQTLGFVELRRDDLDEAQKHFERATQLDSQDALNYYGLGLVAASRVGSAGLSPDAAAAFEKSVALNPDLAAAWYNLSLLYSEKKETLPKALADAQRAASLVPGDSGYQLQVATILNRTGQAEEARQIATHVKQSTDDQKAADRAGDLLAHIPSPGPAPGTPSGAGPSAKPASDSALKIQRKTETEQTPSTNAPVTPQNEQAAASVPPLFSETREYSMVGTITEATCANAPQIQLTLKSETILMKLHADDVAQVPVKSGASASTSKGISCTNLRGRNAHVTYVLASDKAWDGEIRSVEFRSQP